MKEYNDFGNLVQTNLINQSEPPFLSTYEGLMAIQEKFESLKREVYEKDSDALIQGELVGVAAMCRKFYEDLFRN